MALRLACDDERAGAIVELIRKQYAKASLRCYLSKTGKGKNWRRV